jgi:thiol-disulfide isomerase/thioredoxin
MGSRDVNKETNTPAGERDQKYSRITSLYRKPASVMLVGSVLAILLISCGGGSSSGSSTTNDLAPDFTFTLYQGEIEIGAKTLNLSDLRGKPVVINFWAGLCPPCKAELPDLQSFHNNFMDRVTLVGIDLGQFTGLGNQRDALNLLDEIEVIYPNGFTEDSSVIRKYSVLSMPSTFFITSDGAIFRKWSGTLNEDTLVEQTSRMLSQETVAPS